MVAGPDQWAVFLGDLVQLADQGVDVGSHSHQHGRRQLADRGEGVWSPSRYDDEVPYPKTPYLRAEGDVEFAGQNDETLVAAIMNMQRSLRMRMRCQIPPPHDKVSHPPEATTTVGRRYGTNRGVTSRPS